MTEFLESRPDLRDQLLKLQESFSKTPGALNFTQFTLKQKLFDEEDYLAWAQKHYLLPSLKNEYFQMHSPDPKFWLQWKDLYAWNPCCTPLAEWDGVLFIGCLEKPDDFNPEIPACFILCNHQLLESWHQKYVGQVAKVPSPPPAPSPQDISDIFSQGDFSPESLRFDEASVLRKMEVPTPPEKPAEDSILINDNGEVAFAESPEPASGLPEKAAPAASEDQPEGIELAPPTAAAAATATAQEAKPFEDTKAPPVLEKVSPQQIKSDKSQWDATLPLKESTKTSSVATSTSLTATRPQAPKPATAASQKAAPRSSTPVKPITANSKLHFPLKAITDPQPQLLEQFRVICEPMKSHLPKYMFLIVDENEHEARPLFWSDEFTGGDENFTVSLKTPSIFYIAASTHKPFHGYITPNDINEYFFDQWNGGLIPDHATLVPIIHKDRLMGILMGVAELSAYTPQVLRFTEKISHEITNKLVSLDSKAA